MFNIYANKYAPIDPLVPPCEINLIPIGHVGEGQTRCLVFDLTDCINKLGEGTWQISFVRPGDNACYICTNVEQLDNSAIWVITETDTHYAGYGVVQLMYFPTSGGTAKTSQYRTVTFESNGIPGDAPDPYEGLLEQIAQLTSQATAAASTATAAAQAASTTVEEGVKTERSQRIAADEDLQTQITSLMGAVGGPLTAATAAAMTDTSKVYVYVGNESGYNYGHWYYYAGANWADGGVYNATALETDPTLSVEGMAADAAATGDLKSQIMSAFVEESASGSIASFTDGADDVPLKGLVVNITPKQASGTPSPDNVLPITGWTAANINSGVNIYNPNLVTWADGLINADGTIDTSEAMVARYHYTADLLPIKSGTTYTISATRNATDVGTALSFYDANGTFIGNNVVFPVAGAVTGAVSVTFTTPNNAAYYRLRRPRGANAFVNIQIEQGATASEYTEPTVYNVSFGSAGTVYGGTLDVTSGMLTVTWASVDISTLGWYAAASGYGFQRFTTSLTSKANGNSNMLCSRYKTMISADGSAQENYSIKGNNTANYIYARDDSCATVDAFNAANSGVPLVYELAQPVSYQLTATEVRTLLANNNIWSDTGSVASCEYRADTKLYLEKLTNPDSDMVADANITSGSYFMVGNNLYLATANIANNGAIIPGTNCTATNLAAALNAVNA